MPASCKVWLSGLLTAATACNPDAGPLVAPADAEAQYQLALRYITVPGVTPDERAALRWMRQAAEQGYAPAQYERGSYYTLPDSRKDGQAVQWLWQAALQRHAAAPYSPGMLYVRGEGVAVDLVVGMLWVSVAARQGHPDAQTVGEQLGQLLTAEQHEQVQALLSLYAASYGNKVQ